MIAYNQPQNVELSFIDGRPLLSTPQGGKIALDSMLVSLWQKADGHTLDEILTNFQRAGVSPDTIRAALTCLVEAGMLVREGEMPQSLVQQPTRGDLVSVVIVNYNSREWLKECLSSLSAQTFSPLEIIVVNNGSSDDSAKWLETNYPSVKLVNLETSQSLAHAINQGIAAATGAYFLPLNPDVRLEPTAVARLVAVAQSDSSCAAVVAKLKFWWAPAFLNGLGNYVGAFSWGTDNALGHLDLGQFDSLRDLPSACFAAALIPRTAWQTVGAVDENFPLYYEDSEWCYRARLLGWSVRAAPQAIVYHAFGGRAPTGERSALSVSKLHNVVFGRLRFATKLLDGKLRARFVMTYALEDLANLIWKLLRGEWLHARAYWEAWRRFLNAQPELRAEHRTLSKRRALSTKELLALQQSIAPPLMWHGLPELTWDLIVEHYAPLIRSGSTRPMPEFPNSNRRPRLLIISHEVVDAKMAGPGMRYLEMARALSGDVDVTIAIPADTTLEVPGVRLARYREGQPATLELLAEESIVVLLSGILAERYPVLQRAHARLVVDLYDPFVLENLHYYAREAITAQESLNQQAVDLTNHLVRLGDFFICGSERQRDFWLGVLAANGRINPRTFRQDPAARALIDVVGIGFPPRAPKHRPMLRGVRPEFPTDARIVLWGGGIWDWLDPLTLIRAWPQVIAQHPNARLVFLGTRHPNPLVPPHMLAEQAIALASEIGEKDRTIFFYEWLPYTEREALLCEADVGVVLHPLHIETRFSIRTRVLDYFWACLPVLVSDGDVTSEWVRQYGLGKVVPPLDVQAVARALNELLVATKEFWQPAFAPLPEIFNWSRVVEPLRTYCMTGTYAPDHLTRANVLAPAVSTQSWRARFARANYIRRTQGMRLLLHRVWRYAQWRLAEPFSN